MHQLRLIRRNTDTQPTSPEGDLKQLPDFKVTKTVRI